MTNVTTDFVVCYLTLQEYSIYTETYNIEEGHALNNIRRPLRGNHRMAKLVPLTLGSVGGFYFLDKVLGKCF